MAKKSPKARTKKKLTQSKRSVKTTRSGRAKPIPPSIKQAGSRARSKAAALRDCAIETRAVEALEDNRLGEFSESFVGGYPVITTPDPNIDSSELFTSDDPPKKWYQRLADWIRNL